MKRVEIWYCVSSLTDSQTATLSIETNPKTINCYLKKKSKKEHMYWDLLQASLF